MISIIKDRSRHKDDVIMHHKMRKKTLKLAILALSMAGLGFGPGLASAKAASAENLGTFRFWTAWKGDDNSGVMCYISSQPQDTKPENVNRDPIYFLVVNRTGLGTKNEVQTIVGYPLAEESTPQVSVDGRGFDMVVEGSAAWLASASDEEPFVDAMKAGSEMIVKGRSQRGTNTTDTYSLLGVTAAMQKLSQSCN